MTIRKTVDEAAWPYVLQDLRRLGATPGEVRRIEELVECGMHDVAFCLLDAALQRLRDE